uniref:Uncharacterized protein n=1 Tax=Knipowitschia caucasica TaxID=637954 RepID=A0AAV2M2R9_KNICA
MWSDGELSPAPADHSDGSISIMSICHVLSGSVPIGSSAQRSDELTDTADVHFITPPLSVVEMQRHFDDKFQTDRQTEGSGGGCQSDEDGASRGGGHGGLLRSLLLLLRSRLLLLRWRLLRSRLLLLRSRLLLLRSRLLLLRLRLLRCRCINSVLKLSLVVIRSFPEPVSVSSAV